MEPVHSPSYWKMRNESAEMMGQKHRAIFHCVPEVWSAIASKHRDILELVVKPNDSILDIGCGWGRLIGLMPRGWCGEYTGIDLSPDFIKEAKEQYLSPRFRFILGNLLDILPILNEPRTPQYDWAILISFAPMIKRNLGGDIWQAMEDRIRPRAKRLLFLEYDVNDPGIYCTTDGPFRIVGDELPVSLAPCS